MASFEMIGPTEALRSVGSGGGLLVNGYEEPEKWDDTRLPEAISFTEFQQSIDRLPREQELIFYCNCPNDNTAVKRAEEYSAQGFSNVKAVRGGYKALFEEERREDSAGAAAS